MDSVHQSTLVNGFLNNYNLSAEFFELELDTLKLKLKILRSDGLQQDNITINWNASFGCLDRHDHTWRYLFIEFFDDKKKKIQTKKVSILDFVTQNPTWAQALINKYNTLP